MERPTHYMTLRHHLCRSNNNHDNSDTEVQMRGKKSSYTVDFYLWWLSWLTNKARKSTAPIRGSGNIVPTEKLFPTLCHHASATHGYKSNGIEGKQGFGNISQAAGLNHWIGLWPSKRHLHVRLGTYSLSQISHIGPDTVVFLFVLFLSSIPERRKIFLKIKVRVRT